MRLTRRVEDDFAFQNETLDLATEFVNMLDRWHSHKEIVDEELEARILRMKLEIITTNKKRLEWGPKGTRYFSPSSANSDARELYMKLIGAPRDEQDIPPYQGRWRKIGTAFGDMIQTDLLYIEKHWEPEFGEKPPFVPEYVNVNGRLYPAWEKFAQKIMWVEHRGHKIPILGQPDGILRHTKTGTRVGIEIKTKQTTAAQTSYYSLKEPKADHFEQCVNYSIMYGVDDYIIVYGNMSKKNWLMTDEEYRKNPDLRAFHVQITEKDRKRLLDFYADVLDAVKAGEPPKLDLEKWAFNNFKTACALSLTDEEFEEIRGQVSAVMKSRLPDWKKEQYYEAFRFIKEVRGIV